MTIQFIKKHVNALIVFPILLAIALGCLCRSNGSDQCEGVVKVDGRRFVGTAATEKQAGLNACNKFCLTTDKKFDSMYRVWLKSHPAREFERRRKRKPTKQDAIYENNQLMDYITITCANRCYRNANKGNHSLKMSCK